MSSDSDTLPSPALSAGKNPRGRPRQNAAESQHQRIKRLQDELRQAQAALKVSEERRASIVGAAASSVTSATMMILPAASPPCCAPKSKPKRIVLRSAICSPKMPRLRQPPNRHGLPYPKKAGEKHGGW